MRPPSRSLTEGRLLDLPDELLEKLARDLLIHSLPGVWRLRCACKALHGKLQHVQAAADARRLRWMPSLTDANTISAGGCQLRRAGGFSKNSWAMANTLPAGVGRCAWSIKIERSEANDAAQIEIGICCGDGWAWGLRVGSGMLMRFFRGGGKVAACSRRIGSPNNWPGHPTPTRLARWPEDLRSRANGAIIEAVLDDDAEDGRSLSFRLNGGPLLRAFTGFPSRASLHPWVRMAHEDDRVSFRTAYWSA